MKEFMEKNGSKYMFLWLIQASGSASWRHFMYLVTQIYHKLCHYV